MITRERWLVNLLDDARALADKAHQERCWTAPDAKAWENPGELLTMTLDDHSLDLFIKEYSPSFSEPQREAATAFKNALEAHIRHSPHKLNPRDVLVDPEWQRVRGAAATFVVAFEQQRQR